jgi:hypothetical protein
VEEQLRRIHEHMRGLGLGALAHANTHACFYSHDNLWWAELSVLQAAHAAELLIKARIAEEHPLLIFEQLPKARTESGQLLSLQDLVQTARSYQFSDLPDRLWAVSGLKLSNGERFRTFGRLRNAIQHFAVPEGVDVTAESILFIYEVVDPFINDCWGLFAVDFNEDTEPEYLVQGLIARAVRFRVSPSVAEREKYIDFRWPDNEPGYQKEMEGRFVAASATADRDRSG